METKPKLLIIMDFIAIIVLIGACIYIYHEEKLVKDIAAGRTNPCYTCMKNMNWQCFNSGNKIEVDNYNSSLTYLSQVESINNETKD